MHSLPTFSPITRPFLRRVFNAMPLVAVLTAVAAGGCESTSTTSTGPSPVKCQVSLGAPASSVDASGGASTVSVTTQPECAWTASAAVDWISGLSPTNGQGTGEVAFQVAANPATSSRQSEIVINDARVRVVQEAAQCRFEIGGGNQDIAANGGAGTLTVTTLAGCSWTATSNASWISLTAPSSGNGNGTIRFAVASNAAGERSGTIAIGGQTILVRQAGATAACTYAITPTSQTIGSAGGAGTPIAVSTASECVWASSSNAPWLTITSGSGTGSGSVVFSVSANVGAARTGTISIAAQTFTVSQAAAPCTYAIAPSSQSIGAAGGAGTGVTVTTAAGCTWTAVSNDPTWITVTSGASGTGNGSVAFTVGANAGAARSGTITIATRTFTVSQAAVAAPCTYMIAPTSQSIGAAGGAGTGVTVTTAAGCAWTAVSNDAWITVTSGASGNGGGSVSFTVGANAGAARSGTLTIATQTFTVSQDSVAAPCTYMIAPTSQSIGAAGGAGTSVTVTTAAGCTWTAVSNDPAWITVTSGASGTGGGSVAFTVGANAGGARSGTITIATQTFTVSQAAVAAPCTYMIAPTSQSIGAAGGAGTSVTVTTAAGCTWTAISNDPSWITVTSGASGTGNGSVAFTVGANAGAARSGTITIATQTFTVSQAAAPCSYMIAPTSQSIGAAGGAGTSVTVTTAASCMWTAVSNDGWITVNSGASGTGSGSVTFTVGINAGVARSGTITIAGQTFTVSQAAAACSYMISPTSQNFGLLGGNGTFTVTTAGHCAWTAVRSDTWISIDSGASGTGNGTVGFSIGLNPSLILPRTGTITIVDQTFTVTQTIFP